MKQLFTNVYGLYIEHEEAMFEHKEHSLDFMRSYKTKTSKYTVDD